MIGAVSIVVPEGMSRVAKTPRPGVMGLVGSQLGGADDVRVTFGSVEDEAEAGGEPLQGNRHGR